VAAEDEGEEPEYQDDSDEADDDDEEDMVRPRRPIAAAPRARHAWCGALGRLRRRGPAQPPLCCCTPQDEDEQDEEDARQLRAVAQGTPLHHAAATGVKRPVSGGRHAALR
jgi:hypothetical protein